MLPNGLVSVTHWNKSFLDTDGKMMITIIFAFSPVFYHPYKNSVNQSVLSSANAFNTDESKIVSSKSITNSGA